MKQPVILLAAVALASCAAPKAVVIQEAPAKKQPAAAPAAPEKPPALADDGLRLPDMLTLPEDSQLRSAAMDPKKADATIITSPPAE